MCVLLCCSDVAFSYPSPRTLPVEFCNIYLVLSVWRARNLYASNYLYLWMQRFCFFLYIKIISMATLMFVLRCMMSQAISVCNHIFILCIILPTSTLFIFAIWIVFFVFNFFFNFLKFLGTTKLMIKQEQCLLFRCRFVTSNWE